MLSTLMLIYLVALLLIPLKLQFVGGNGRRRLTAVALESEGYTGTVLRSATAGGKFMLYIAPLPHVQGGCEGTSRMTLSNSEVRLICHIL